MDCLNGCLIIILAIVALSLIGAAATSPLFWLGLVLFVLTALALSGERSGE